MLLVPPGVNLKIMPVLESASNKLPEPSKARPAGLFRPEAKALLVPSGVNLKILKLPESASYRSPGAALMLVGTKAVTRPATVTSR